MTELEQIRAWAEIASSIGVGGLLFMIVYAFYSGRVIPRDLVEKMLSEADERTIKIVNELRREIANAVKDGITEALVEIRRENFQRENKKL